MTPPAAPAHHRQRLADGAAFREAALGYAARGWHVLQVRPRSKAPVVEEWQTLATVDPAVIKVWWPPRGRWNLGVQLGPRSGIIDVECDSPEAERALSALLGEDYPVVPTFAAKRGKHRLFLWTPDLPHPDKAVFWFRGVEFRTGNGGRGAQSVFPPSVHPDGPVYAWLVHPDDADPVAFPAAALEIIRRETDGPPARGGTRGRRAPALADGEKIPVHHRNATLTSLAGSMRRRGFGERAIRAALLEENAERCVPPLGEVEVGGIAASVARYEPADVPAAPAGPGAPPRRRVGAGHRLTHIRVEV
jgi:putative DNA primase/helicase